MQHPGLPGRMSCHVFRELQSLSSLWLVSVLLGVMPASAVGDETRRTDLTQTARLEFFETRIRPVLVEHCYACHSADAKSVKGGLKLDSREALLAGGDSGSAVIPGDPDESLLLQAIRHTSFEMPPDRKLPQQVARDFEQWIRDGAVDPREGTVEHKSSPMNLDERRSFWSFQPVTRPVVPQPASPADAWIRNDCDAFIAARHQQHGVQPVGDATPEQLIVRLHFVLTGLRPDPDQIDTFVAAWKQDEDAAVQSTVDELLASPRFGERWGRHWLDVARFAESSGGGRSLMYPHAWQYRDYVIRAFNSDKPFDQFVREQIAGDLLPASDDAQRDDQLTGSGYLIMGAINFEQQDKEALRMDVIDEQIDAVGRTFLGMTLGCARCHDHKFDPIPTSDYYALAGIFRSTHTLTPGNVSGYVTSTLRTGYDPQPLEQWTSTDKQLRQQIAELQKQTPGSTPAGASPILAASLPGIVVDDDQAVFTGEWTSSQTLRPFVGAGYRHSGHAKTGIEARFTVNLPADGKYEVRLSHDFSSSRSSAVPVTVYHADGSSTVQIDQTRAPSADGVFTSVGAYHFSANNPAVVVIDAAGAQPGYVIADAVQWIAAEQESPLAATGNATRVDPARVDAAAGDAPSGRSSRADLASTAKQLDLLQKQLAAHQKTKPAVPEVMCVEDEAEPADWHIHLRGDAHRHGPIVPRGFLTVATPVEDCSMTDAGTQAAAARIADPGSSGRLELAHWLTSPSNPLTARVFVNRVWMHVMGEGLVRNPDNFGATGFPPTHPLLLDYLAHTFVHQDHYSVKALIRRMCTSRTFRMSVTPTEIQRRADPENLQLTRMFSRRIDAETLRDSILQISGQLDLSLTAGRTIGRLSTYDNGYEHEKYPLRARSVFVPAFRNAMLDLFFVFDVANPNMVTGRRTHATLPAQSLYLMNSPFVAEHAQLAADRFLKSISNDGHPDDPEHVDQLIHAVWRQTLGRHATDSERRHIREHLQKHGAESAQAWADVFHAIFGSVDFRFID